MTNFAIITTVAPTQDGSNNLVTTTPDGGLTTVGTTTDVAYTSGAGTAVSLLKGIFTRLRGGQASMANSLPVTLASDQATHPVYQTSSGSVSGTLQTAATATGVGTPLTVLGNSTAVLTVSGTFVASVTFQGSEDGTNWTNLSATQMGASVINAVATAPGTYELACAGLQSVRANITAYTSGSITVTAHAVPLPFNVRSVNANPSAGAVVAPSSPPAATVANTDAAYTFTAPCRTGRIQNKTAANLYYELDGATAVTVGSAMIAPGQTEWINVPFTTIHLLTAAIQNINGSADLNITVKGWA